MIDKKLLDDLSNAKRRYEDAAASARAAETRRQATATEELEAWQAYEAAKSAIADAA